MPTFLDAVVRADAAIVNFVEGSSTQAGEPGRPRRPSTAHLTAEEIAAIRGRMGTIRMLTYRVEALPRDAAARRKLLEFAKAMGADTVVVPMRSTPTDRPATLADEFEINVAAVAGSSDGRNSSR